MNLTLLPAMDPPLYDCYLDVIIEGVVRIIETAGNSPRKYGVRAKAAGVKVIHKCVVLRQALSALH